MLGMPVFLFSLFYLDLLYDVYSDRCFFIFSNKLAFIGLLLVTAAVLARQVSVLERFLMGDCWRLVNS